MPGRSLAILAILLALLSGCASSDPANWHTRIKPAAPGHPKGAVDPETGEALWHDYAEQEFPYPLPREAAFEVLLSTETFADAYVGYGGTKSTQVDAFQVVLEQPDAVDAFQDLLRRSHMAGQLYALCGLRLLSPAKYGQAEAHFLTSDATVPSQQGCVGGAAPVRELVHAGDSNRIDLQPGESIEQWYARVKPPGNAALSDISGGAIPQTFRDAH